MSGDDIPDFLKRTETPEQAEARRKKNAPKDTSKGLKVIEPPDPKIMAAVAKDFVEKGRKAQEAVDKIIADDASDKKVPKKVSLLSAVMSGKVDTGTALTAIGGFPKSKRTKPVGKKETALREQREAKAKTTKPASGVLAKALKERDALNALAQQAKQTTKPMEATVQKTKTKKATTKKATKTKKSATKRASNGTYDWDAAEKMAASGKLPPMPTFRSYAPHIKDFYDLAKKKDLAGIKKYAAGFVNEKGARANMFRFRDLLVKALRA